MTPTDKQEERRDEMENTIENTTDGFAALDTIAASFTGTRLDAIAVEHVPVFVEMAAPIEVPVAPVAVEAPIPAPKADRRKGERKIKNIDGTMSYGVKADGTPRQKPGRKAKAGV